MSESNHLFDSMRVVDRDALESESTTGPTIGQTSLLASFEETRWPDPEAFPLNEGRRKAGAIVAEDLAASDSFLAVTGFTSLAHLVQTFGREPGRDGQRVDVVLGNEPLPATSVRSRRQPLPDAVREYWLQQGISILHCGSVLRLVERIRAGEVRFFGLDGLHAKMYVGDEHAVLGSSNFSRSGLYQQKEANVRFAREGAEAGRYEDARRVAENYRLASQPMGDEIVGLLEQLLQAVTWQEALARAVAELLEGEWIGRYPQLFTTAGEHPLWPSQVQAVAQALWVLDSRGSVLIADPTGSGKTRTGVTLLWALVNRLWGTGRSHRARCAVICPPQVKGNWEDEADEAAFAFVRTVSQGVLSQSRSTRHEKATQHVRDAAVLFVDEAHNYLNPQSGRSRQVLASGADHTALLTATPINRGAQDLLRLVELLGLDNLSDAEYRTFRALRAKRGRLTRSDEDVLREFVERFTVRRTKADLNRMVDAEPEAYRNRLGDPCRYPEHRCHMYATGETAHDVELAEAIDERAGRLRGLLYLRQIHVLEDSAVPPEAAVKGRLAAGAALARYNVRAALRSSPAALVEHVWGTERAAAHFGLGSFKAGTGDVAGTMQTIEADARGGWAPATNVADALPDWLTDSEQVAEAAREEAGLYEEIAELALGLSDARQRARIALLDRLRSEHGLLIAYDRSLITLEHLKAIADAEDVAFTSYVVTGSRGASAKRRIKEEFALGSDAEGVVALCSDAMSEGVNLQQASAVVFLDAPSVIRLAEQRVGRVDRMDSPHEAIDVYWPNDSPAFALRSSRRFVERYLTVDRILGSNMPLPEELLEAGIAEREETIGADELIETYERRQAEAATWDGLHDAFQPVRDLVHGPLALVPDATYEAMRGARAAVMSEVSLVRATTPWAFFAVRGTEARAPRWVLVEAAGEPTTELAAVCAELRQRLDGVEQLTWSDGAATWVERLLLRLRAAERDGLPNRRRHALDLMAKTLVAYERDAAVPERRAVVRELLHALADPKPHEPGVDLYELAQAWLDVVRPVFLRVQDRRRRHPLRLKSRALVDELKRSPLSTDDLRSVAERIEGVDPLERRVAACVVGVPLTD